MCCQSCVWWRLNIFLPYRYLSLAWYSPHDSSLILNLELNIHYRVHSGLPGRGQMSSWAWSLMTTQLYRISFRTVAVKNQIINPTGPTTRWPSTIRSVVKKFYGLTGILLLPKFHFYPTHQKMSFSPKNLVDFRPFILIFVNKSFFIQNFNQLIQKTTQQMAHWNLKFKTKISKILKFRFRKNFLNVENFWNF